jgi:Glycosyl transferase family 2
VSSEGVTVVIPHIPTRRHLLLHSGLPSVFAQTYPATAVVVEVDYARSGAGPTRTRGLRKVTTRWTAFLDDDDHLYDTHLEICLAAARDTGADVVVPWFDTNGHDPFPENRGRRYDPAHHHTFPVTCLVRTGITGDASFPPAATPECSGDDEVFWKQLAADGARIECIPDVTWFWNHAPPGGNTSGSPARWRL